ncbi:MAG: PA14 domain-containing protein [Reichenbachiella sp.]
MRLYKNRLKQFALGIILSTFTYYSSAQSVPFPATPDYEDFAPWGYEQKGTNWDTSPFLPFRHHSFGIRLMPPNGVTYNSGNNQWSYSEPGKKYPIILFFHGRGEGGDDNNNTLKHGGKRHRDAVLSGEFPGFLLYPQDVNPQQMKDVLDKMVETGLPVDLTRVYVHGLSRGGQRTWEFLYAYPELVAAAWPMSGVATGDYNDILYMPIRLAQGELDKNPTPAAASFHVDNITDLGGHIELNYLPGVGHGTWNHQYYRSDFFSWFLSHSLQNTYAKYDYSEICPEDPIDVTLGMNPGLAGYQWRKDDLIIAGAIANELHVTEYGNYSSRVIFAPGDTTEWSEGVVVGERQPTQTPPITLASMDSPVLPDINGKTTVDLTLPIGYESYEWFKDGVSVGASQVISAATGEYTALVEEQFGCSSELSTPFNVIANSGVDVPAVPVDVNADMVSMTSIHVGWTEPATDETAIELYRRQLLIAPYELIAVLDPNTIEYLDEELDPGTEYFYSLRSINNNGSSVLSVEVSTLTDSDTNLPTVPLNLALQATTDASVTLVWDESSDDVGVARYDLYQNGVKVLTTGDTFISIYNLIYGEIYRFNVVAVDISGNKSPMSNRVVVSPVLSGLNYKYYEGAWSVLPDFNALSPLTQGNSENVNIGVKLSNDNFGFLWEGKISIPVAGNYTFETYSDDGSKLYIGGYDESNLIVNNDGLHGSVFQAGTYNFPTAGSYDIAISFFERGGGERMEVYWSNTAHGVGSRQAIPSSAFSDEMAIPDEFVNEPINLAATVISTSGINLSWTDQSNNEINFQVFRSKESAFDFEPIALLGTDITSYEDSELDPDTEYFYKVIALGQYGQSGGSTTINTLLEMPLDNSVLDLSGNDVESNTSGAITYDNSNKVIGASSISFAGSGSYLNIDNGNQFIHNEFTERSFAFWMYTASTTGVQDVFDEGGSTNGYGIRINDGKIEIGVQDNHNIVLISAPITSNEWVHIASNFNNGRIELYVNGILSAENDNVGYSSVSAHGNGGGLGATNSSNAFDVANNNYSGLIDDFLMLDFAIGQSDVNGIFNRANEQSIISATTESLPQPEDPVQNFVVNVIGQNKVEMTWDTNEVMGYQVLRAKASSPSDYELIGYLDETIGTHIDSARQIHTDYYYTIRARFTTGYTAIVEPVLIVIPNAEPILLNAIPDYDLFYLDQESLLIEVNDADGDIVSFQSSNFPSFVSLVDNGDNTATLSIDPEASDFGTYEILSVSIDDGYGGVTLTDFDVVVVSNNAPEVDAFENQTMSGGETLSYVISASDINGDNLSWVVNNLPSFATATPNANGESVTLDFAPSLLDDGGVYIIDLHVDDDNSITSMFSEVQLILNVVSFDPNHKIYVNFGFNSDGTEPWNNFTYGFPSSGKSLDNLVNDQGFVTDVSVYLETSWSGNGVSGGMHSGIYEQNVMQTYFYTDGSSEVFSITGLDPANVYNFDFFASRNGSGDRRTTYQIGGSTATIDAAGNTSDLAIINGIAPDANGEIEVTIIRPSGASYSYLNAMVMEAVSQNGIAPLKPTDLQVSVDGQINLTWSDNAVNEEGYRVLRSSNSGGAYDNLSTLDANISSFEDGGMATDQNYYYMIEVYNAFGTAQSDEIEIFIPNLAPGYVVTPELILAVDAEQLTILNFEAADSPGDVISYSLFNAPSFIVLSDIGDGTAQLEVSPLSEDFGLYEEIEVIVSDGTLNNSFVFDLSVNPTGFEEFFVNITSTTMASTPWNNFVTGGDTGDAISNLISNEGEVSTISIELLDDWGGINPNGMTSGVFPSEVSSISIWESSTAPNRIRMSGMDPNKIYKFGFFASRNGNGERIAEYSIGGKTVFLNASYNTDNVVYIENILPDASGEIEVIAAKRGSSTYGYLNAMTIESMDYVPGVVEEDPIVLSARGINGTDIQLSWVETIVGEDEIEVWSSSSEEEASFGLLTTLTANSTNYLNEGVTPNQVYYYKVRTKTGDVYSDFSNVSNSSTVVFSVLLNFNPDTPAAAPWNNINLAPFPNLSITDLLNTSGQNTGISMTLPESNPNYPNYGFNGDNPFGMVTGDDSGVVPDNVMRSTYWMDPGMTAEAVFGGMSLAYKYSFEFFASRDGNGNRTTDYTIDGKTVSLDAAKNTMNTVIINDVVASNETAEVTVVASTNANSQYGYLGAVMIYAYSYDPGAEGARVFEGAPEEGVSDMIASIVAYPNPFNDRISISYDSNSLIGRARLVDVQGRVIVDREVNSSTGFEIATNQLESGVYILELIYTDGSNKIIRMIK